MIRRHLEELGHGFKLKAERNQGGAGHSIGHLNRGSFGL
jgi:hypothetical protein